MDKLSVVALMIFFPSFQKGEDLKCIYGDQPICGSDGVTYLNRCDLEIVRTVHPYLNMIHHGPCKYGAETRDRVLNFIELYNDAGSLRRNRKLRKKHRPFKVPFHGGNTLGIDLKKVVMSRFYDSLMTLSAFNMEGNNMSTDGNNNVFQITFGNDGSKRH